MTFRDHVRGERGAHTLAQSLHANRYYTHFPTVVKRKFDKTALFGDTNAAGGEFQSVVALHYIYCKRTRKLCCCSVRYTRGALDLNCASRKPSLATRGTFFLGSPFAPPRLSYTCLCVFYQYTSDGDRLYVVYRVMGIAGDGNRTERFRLKTPLIKFNIFFKQYQNLYMNVRFSLLLVNFFFYITSFVLILVQPI